VDGRDVSADGLKLDGIESGATGDQNASEVEMDRIAGSTYSTVQHLQDLFHSSGYTSGGAITDAGGATIDVSAGTGFIRPTNDSLDELLFFDFPASLGISIPSDSIRYIGVEYNAGSPQVVSRTTNNFNNNTDFILGDVVNEGGTLYILNSPHAVGDHASFMIQRAYETMPLARDSRTGGLILGETGTRNVVVSAGALWERLERFAISSIDTSVSGSFDRYYRDGVGGWTKESTQTQYPNTQYDDGSGTLATMTNNRYANLWFYIDLNGDLAMLYGQAEYSTIANAEAEAPPSTIPDRLLANAKLIGRILFQESAATAESIGSVFSTTFSNAIVTDHGSLSGLLDDDHTQYTLADGTRAFTGDIDMGANDITNVGTVFEDMPAETLKGNDSLVTADSQNLTVTEVLTMLKLRRYITTDITPTRNTETIHAHGLGPNIPYVTGFELECVTADQGYSIGDVISDNCLLRNGEPAMSLVTDATNLTVIITDAGDNLRALNKTSRSVVNLTNANWRLRVILKERP
jgi:hypothetical protein